jgi:hypothetical protein
MKRIPIWLITFTLAFIAGFFTSKVFEKKQISYPLASKQNVTPTNQKEKQVSIYVSGNKKTPTVESEQNSTSGASTQLSLVALTEELESYANNGAGGLAFSELSRLYLIVGNLPDDQVLELMRTFFIDNIEDDSSIFSVLFSKYIEANSEAALDFVSDEITDTNLRSRYLGQVVDSIAKTDPIAAYEYVLQDIDAKDGLTDRNQIAMTSSLYSVFESLAKRDRLLAIDKLNELSQLGHSITIPALGLTQALESKQEFINFLTMTKSIDNHEIERAAIGKWTRSNPEEVGAWLIRDYTGNRYDEIEERLIQNWSYIDREKSADWMITNSRPEKLSKNLANFVGNWGYDNPTEAMQWFKQQSVEIYNQNTLSDFLGSVAYSHPQFAVNHLRSIEGEKGRSRVAQSIYQGFKRNSSSKAEAFLEQSPFREEILKLDASINR